MLALLVSAWAQEGPPLTWAPVLDLRSRALLGAEDGAWSGELAQRARAGLGAERGAVSARVSFQAVRAWSDEAPTSVDLAEGWARFEGDLSPNVGAALTIGRQPLTVHEGRLVGDHGWTMDGLFLDAVRAELWLAPFEIEYANARRFLTAGEDAFGLGLNLVRVGLGREGPVSRWRGDLVSVIDSRGAEPVSTSGLYARFDVGRWRSSAEGYVQVYGAEVGTLAAARLGWVLGPDERWTVSGGVDALSGTDAGSAIVAFDPVLGNPRTFYGALDRWSTPEGNGERGLVDTDIAVELRPSPAWRLQLAARRLWTATDGADLGAEVDAGLRWWITPFGALTVGYAHGFAAGPDVPAADLAWLDLDVTF